MLLGLQVTPAICTTNDQILTIDVGLSIKVNVKEENIPIKMNPFVLDILLRIKLVDS